MTLSYLCISCKYILWSKTGPLRCLSPSLPSAVEDWLGWPVGGLWEVCRDCHKFTKIGCLLWNRMGGRWWRTAAWWNKRKCANRACLTHRGATWVLLRFATVAAAGLGGAGWGSRGTHQVEHMVLVLLWKPVQLITVQSLRTSCVQAGVKSTIPISPNWCRYSSIQNKINWVIRSKGTRRFYFVRSSCKHQCSWATPHQLVRARWGFETGRSCRGSERILKRIDWQSAEGEPAETFTSLTEKVQTALSGS